MTDDLKDNPFVQLFLAMRQHQAELDKARWAAARDCRRRVRRWLAEDAWAWSNYVEDPYEEYPLLKGARKGCRKILGDRSPCTFPTCGALDTYGIPLDAETRARYKIPKMEHDPE